MNLPISTIKNLELTGIEYEVYALVDDNGNTLNPLPPNSQIAMLILLEDSIGKMQCLLTQDFFIDLTMLCETLGRNLKGLCPTAKLKIAHSFGLEKLSSLPSLTNFPCVISSEIVQAKVLYFESGKENILIKITHQNIQKLLQSKEEISFSRKISHYRPIQSNQSTEDEASIRKAVQDFTTLRIKQRLETTLEIPPMPDTSKKIIQLRVDANAGVAELATIVETDPSLAAQVVSWASSPYYAAPGKINSVHDAVIRVLGFDLVINLALGLSLGRGLSLPTDGAQGITPYWKQAVYCAATTEIISRQIPQQYRPEPGLAYLSGLLHNFGYLILGYVFPPHLSLINRYIEANPHAPLNVIEHYLLGVTREQLAAWLFNSWNMPKEIVTAIRWQNSPQFNGQFHSYSNTLYIANQILHAHQIGVGPTETIPDKLLNSLDINQQELLTATEKVWENIEHLDSIAKNLNKNT